MMMHLTQNGLLSWRFPFCYISSSLLCFQRCHGIIALPYAGLNACEPLHQILSCAQCSLLKNLI